MLVPSSRYFQCCQVPSEWKCTFLYKGSWWAYTRMVPYWRGWSHCIPNWVRTFCTSGRHWGWISPSAECWSKKCCKLSWLGWNNKPMKIIIMLDAGWCCYPACCCYLARYSLISLCCSLISSCYYLTCSCCSLISCCYIVITSCWIVVIIDR
jgi:hypothetical protein